MDKMFKKWRQYLFEDRELPSNDDDFDDEPKEKEKKPVTTPKKSDTEEKEQEPTKNLRPKDKTKTPPVEKDKKPVVEPKKQEQPKNNVVALFDMEDDMTGRSFSSMFDVEDPNQVIKLVKQIKPLQTNAIKKVAGAGHFGIVYTLDNDHVLKLFNAGVSGGEKEIEKFKQIQDRQFQGISHKNEPAVYDIGVANIDRKDFEKDEPDKIYYLELGRVQPFQSWMINNKQDETAWEGILMNLRRYIQKNFDRIKGKNSRFMMKTFFNFIEQQYDSDEQRENLKKISLNTLASLMRGVSTYINKTGKPTDFHSGNFGVIPSNGKNPDTFVFFDI